MERYLQHLPDLLYTVPWFDDFGSKMYRSELDVDACCINGGNLVCNARAQACKIMVMVIVQLKDVCWRQVRVIVQL